MRVRAWRAVAGLGLGLVIVVVAVVMSCHARETVSGDASPNPSWSWRGTVQIADVVPAKPAASPREDTEAVRALREFHLVAAWASLTGTTRFQQFDDVGPALTEVDRRNYPGTKTAATGPIAFTPLEVREQIDGTTVVEACVLSTWRGTVGRSSGLPVPAGEDDLIRVVYVLAPLSANERAELGERAEDSTGLRVRYGEVVRDEAGEPVSCSDVPVVLQTFQDWRRYLGTEVDE